MGTMSSPTVSGWRFGRLFWLGLLFLMVGLLGHALAARADGGTYADYRNHLLGLAGMCVASGLLVAAAGALFWKRRLDITILVVGALQAVLGVWMYLERFHVHG